MQITNKGSLPFFWSTLKTISNGRKEGRIVKEQEAKEKRDGIGGEKIKERKYKGSKKGKDVEKKEKKGLIEFRKEGRKEGREEGRKGRRKEGRKEGDKEKERKKERRRERKKEERDRRMEEVSR